jgi:hypothetical protein
MKRIQVLSIIAVTVVLLVSIVLVAYARGNANPRVLPPTSRVQGLTYGDWQAEWWKYVLSVPADQNPLAGAPDACIFRLVGNVGLVVGNSTLAPGTPIPCTVPVGTMLFVEVLGAECSTLEPDPFHGGNAEELLSCANGFVPERLQASIDGVEVQDLTRYIVASPVYDFTVPEENILGVPGGSNGQSIASGAYLMLSPLRPGIHTIRLHGEYPGFPYTADKTFTLTVGE